MPKYHVHVYRTTQFFEIDLEADNSQDARQKALDEIKNSNPIMKPSDCNFIALDFKIEDS